MMIVVVISAAIVDVLMILSLLKEKNQKIKDGTPLRIVRRDSLEL